MASAAAPMPNAASTPSAVDTKPEAVSEAVLAFLYPKDSTSLVYACLVGM